MPPNVAPGAASGFPGGDESFLRFRRLLFRHSLRRLRGCCGALAFDWALREALVAGPIRLNLGGRWCCRRCECSRRRWSEACIVARRWARDVVLRFARRRRLFRDDDWRHLFRRRQLDDADRKHRHRRSGCEGIPPVLVALATGCGADGAPRFRANGGIECRWRFFAACRMPRRVHLGVALDLAHPSPS